MPSSSRLLVSLATYNEHDNLGPLTAEILQTLPSAHLLVIDDNSPDGTGELADKLAWDDPRIHVLHRPSKLGLGTATIQAIKYAIEHDYDLLLNMDADFSHHPRYLPALLAGMDRHDIMIGSRYVRGGGSENWPWQRLLISKTVNAMVRFLMRIPAHDCSGAYRCYRVALLERVPLDQILSRGYSFQQEVLYRCRKAGARIGETPIVFANRRAGASKVNTREAVRSISLLLYLGIRAFLGMDSPGVRIPK